MIIFIILSVAVLGQKSYSSGILTYRQFSKLNSNANENFDESWLGLSVSGERGKKVFYDYDLSARLLTGSSKKVIYSASEFFIGRKRGRTSYSIGRHILPWNGNEEFWSLGDLNAVRSFNHLEQKREGVFGVHFNRQSKSFSQSCFISYVHVPQLNPTYSYGNGKITPKNRWASPPQEAVRFNEQTVPVYYDIESPPIKDVLLQEALGCSLSLYWKRGGISSYLTWKPENSVRINATGHYDLSDEFAYVKAKPFVNHHLMAGVGFNQEIGDLRWMAHLDTVRPKHGSDESFKFEFLRIEPIYTNQTYFTLSLTLEDLTYLLGLHFFQNIEGDYVTQNTFAKKPKWHRAVGGFIKVSPLAGVHLTIDIKYDLKLKDSTFKGESQVHFWKHYVWGLGAEIIDSPKNESFWGAFRANDTVYTNFAYKF